MSSRRKRLSAVDLQTTIPTTKKVRSTPHIMVIPILKSMGRTSKTNGCLLNKIICRRISKREPLWIFWVFFESRCGIIFFFRKLKKTTPGFEKHPKNFVRLSYREYMRVTTDASDRLRFPSIEPASSLQARCSRAVTFCSQTSKNDFHI